MTSIPAPNKFIGCQNLINDSKVTLHGSLRRQNKFDKLIGQIPIKKWSQVYVVLFNGCLYVFDNELSLRPSRCTSLFGFNNCEPVIFEDSSKAAWPFKLFSNLDEIDKCILFSAPSENLRKNWIETLKSEMNRVNKLILTDFSKPDLTLNFEDTPTRPPRHTEFLSTSTNINNDNNNNNNNNKNNNNNNKQFKTINVVNNKKNPNLFATFVNRKRDMNSNNQLYSNNDVYNDDYEENIIQNNNINNNDIIINNNNNNNNNTNNNNKDLENETEESPYKNIKMEDFYWIGNPIEAENIMKKVKVYGVFMVRKSTDANLSYTLLVKIAKGVSKYKIYKNEKEKLFINKENGIFDNLMELIFYYHGNLLPYSEDKLTTPYYYYISKIV